MVEDVFYVAEKQLLTTKGGKPYIRAQLRDKTGDIDARWWDVTKAAFEGMPTEGFYLVKGTVEIFKAQAQIRIEAGRPIDADSVDPADFMPACPRDIDEMFADLKALLDTVNEPHLKALIDATIGDAELADRIRRSPAAVRNHHAYLGGLLEHTLSMAQGADLLCGHYKELDRDMLLAGVLFHDIGKTVELICDIAFSYSDPGQLIGHLIQGVLMLEEKSAELAKAGNPVPEETLDLLRHMILSHHGEYEFGSPKLPMTAEAVVLHHLDNMDAKLQHMFLQFSDDADPESRWTGWSRMLRGRIFKGPSQGSQG
jgi:3'-5' exoribonuclease